MLPTTWPAEAIAPSATCKQADTTGKGPPVTFPASSYVVYDTYAMARAHVRPRKASRRTTSPSLSCIGSPRRRTRDTRRSRDRRPRGRPDVATSTARREAASAVPLTPAHPDDGVSTNRRLCTDTRKPTGKRHHSSSWRGPRTEPAVAASGRPSPRHLQVDSGYAARCHRQMRADEGLQPAVGRPRSTLLPG